MSTAKERRIAVLWAQGVITGVEAAKRLNCKQQNVYGKLANALKYIHYEQIRD